jgi:hypothetical protein
MRRLPRGGSTHQLTLDWTAAVAPPAPAPHKLAVEQSTAKVETVPAPPRRKEGRHVHKIKESRRIVARLPVPQPLLTSVDAGTFGRNEDGSVIHPGTDEIRAITESLVDRLIELLDAIPNVRDDSARQAFEKQFREAITMYGIDFGDHAAGQLEAYVRRQALLDEDQRAERDGGWHR